MLRVYVYTKKVLIYTYTPKRSPIFPFTLRTKWDRERERERESELQRK